MNKYTIAIKKLNGLFITPEDNMNVNQAYAFNADMIQLGYVMSEDLFNYVKTLSKKTLKVVHQKTIKTLREIVGANVSYNPMYPNFPEQVMEASDEELFVNAILHYWTHGQWMPDYVKTSKPFYPEDVNLKVLDYVDANQFDGIFTKILGSNDSISAEDKEIVEYFLNTPERKTIMPETIPFKENLCLVAGYCLGRELSIDDYVTNSTDVLRIATYLSEGDVSLSQNTKFKSFPRSQRRALVSALEGVIKEEDIARHANKWVKLFHSLHVGDYSKKVFDIAKKVRENVKIETFNSNVESALLSNDFSKATKLLKTRPSEFARRLDHVLRVEAQQYGILRTENTAQIVFKGFLEVIDQVSTNVLFQLLGHFRTRMNPTSFRVALPKGSTQKAIKIEKELPALDYRLVQEIVASVLETLQKRFSELPEMGNVYIDPVLANAPLPTQQRSASTAMKTVARGTRMPFGGEDKNTLRFFIYWVGQDIDLSATFHDENFKTVDHISYTNLRNAKLGTYHSGDITSAYHGAAEFIDIDIEKALKAGMRYVTMNVLVFSGPTFAEHETCYAGWMTREKPDSNEIFDPKTVEQKVDVTSESRNVVPVTFDLETREAIWTDLNTNTNTGSRYSRYGGNNVENNKASIEDVMQMIASLSTSKATLYDLFSCHLHGRGGTQVNTPEEADVVFGLFDGDVKATDVTEINSVYMV